MSKKSLFNWLIKKPSQQFTLGEAIMGQGFGDQYSQGERLVERTFTIGGLLAAVVTAATGGDPQTALGLAAGGKALGMAGAAFTRVATGQVHFSMGGEGWLYPEPAPVYATVTVDPSRRNNPGRKY